jgi:hypothetical protein
MITKTNAELEKQTHLKTNQNLSELGGGGWTTKKK